MNAARKNDTATIDPLKKLSNREIEILEENGYDLDFIKQTMPQGGIEFSENHITCGNGISKCITIYKYSSDPELFWLAYLMNNPHTIATMDVKTDAKYEVIQSINKALDEMEDLADNERCATDRNKYAADYMDLAQYAQSLTRQGEISKQIKVRIHVYGATQEECDERAQHLIAYFNSKDYKAVTYLNKATKDWESLFLSMTQQEAWFGNIRGRSIPALNIGGGIPFHHQTLKDAGGSVYGHTQTGGTFVWNVTLKDSIRFSSNSVLFGTMGAGKSTVLKMIAENHLPNGDYIWGFEKGKDFIPFLKEYGGTMVRLDGSEGMVNPLEIFATKTNDNGTVINQRGSYMTHLDKVTHQVGLVNPHLKGTLRSEFKLYLNKFYESIDMVPLGYTKRGTKLEKSLIGRKPEEYPTFSQFRTFVENIDLKNESPKKRDRREEILVMVDELCETYGTIFDGYSTIENLSQKQLVFFDIDSISGLDKGVQQCQMYMALTLIWNQALIMGRSQIAAIKDGKMKVAMFKRFMAFIDECHNIINPEFIETVKYITDFQREMRKVEAMTILATQSPQEMVPENTTSEVFSELKKVFEFSATKIFMKMDESTLNHIGNLVGKSMTTSELESIPQQKKGDAVINFGNEATYRVHFSPSERQLKLFSGGA